MAELDFEAIRDTNLRHLDRIGFQVAESLPTGPNEGGSSLRPIEEIGRRLLALQCVFLYASDFGENEPEDVIREALGSNNVSDLVANDEEAKIIQMPRSEANETYGHIAGWFLERMLPLAWILGLDHTPDPDGDPLGGDKRDALVQFVGRPTPDLSGWIATFTSRSEHDVVVIEDLFYCAHNAVRSAQCGEETVPDDFDPVFNGGVIQERRHSLTWALSPGVSWSETDLST